jgi:methyl-accepting chemotaxis protein
MLDQIRRLFAAPVFEDEEKTRVGGLLNTVVLGLLAMSVVYGIAMIVTQPGEIYNLVILAAVVILESAVLVLLRLGQVQGASLLQSAILWIIITIANYTSGGVNAAGAIGYALVLVMVSLLMSSWAVFAFAGLTILAEAYFVYAEINGLMPPPRMVNTPINAWVIHAAVLVIMGLVLYLSKRSITGAFERVYRNERALAESNRELQATRTSLEQHNEHLKSTVQRYAEYMDQVGRGNLAARLTLDENPEEADTPLNMLGRRLNEATASLHSMIARVRDAARNLGESSTEILAATTQQMSGASEQSAAISQTTTTVDEVKVIADQSVARAQDVADMSQRTVEVSRAGTQAVQDTIDSMGEIKTQVEGIAENILTLSQHTQQIREIIATVNDLASQSNMLALNAAVEAARAGEHGKGFAVVAQEVRSLADQSKQATAQVRTILEDIQRATNTTVMATEEGTKKADAGVRLAVQSGEAIRQLAGVIDESTQAAMQMVASGRQQASGIEQIALAMQNINQATAQSLSSTRQAENAAQDLNTLAGQLNEVVTQYRL